MNIELSAVPVYFVEAETYPSGITRAWSVLAEHLPDMELRTLIGWSRVSNKQLTYRACATPLEGEEPDDYQVGKMQIPGGHYARTDLDEWKTDPYKIGKAFDELASGYTVDPIRPYLELYGENQQVSLFVPFIPPFQEL